MQVCFLFFVRSSHGGEYSNLVSGTSGQGLGLANFGGGQSTGPYSIFGALGISGNSHFPLGMHFSIHSSCSLRSFFFSIFAIVLPSHTSFFFFFFSFSQGITAHSSFCSSQISAIFAQVSFLSFLSFLSFFSSDSMENTWNFLEMILRERNLDGV